MTLVKIESGPAEIVASGSVIAFSGNPITITYGTTDKPLKLVFAFKDEEGREDLKVEGSVHDPVTLKLTLYNFKNPLGSGTTDPMPIGTLGGRRLYIHYRVYQLTGSSDKMLVYSIYRGEEVGSNE